MAAGSWTVYSHFMDTQENAKSIDLNADTFYIALFTNSYTPAPNTDATYTNISADEVATGGGYTVGGVALTGLSNTLATATETFTSGNPSWATFTATFRYAVIIHSASGSGIVSTDVLVCYCDCTGSGSITGGGGTLTIQMNASGIFTTTHSP